MISICWLIVKPNGLPNVIINAEMQIPIGMVSICIVAEIRKLDPISMVSTCEIA